MFKIYIILHFLLKAEEKRLWREAHPDSSSEESEEEEDQRGARGRGGGRGKAGMQQLFFKSCNLNFLFVIFLTHFFMASFILKFNQMLPS